MRLHPATKFIFAEQIKSHGVKRGQMHEPIGGIGFEALFGGVALQGAHRQIDGCRQHRQVRQTGQMVECPPAQSALNQAHKLRIVSNWFANHRRTAQNIYKSIRGHEMVRWCV